MRSDRSRHARRLALLASWSLFLAGAMGFADETKPSAPASRQEPLATFIELGSVNCVPCKAMRPVMTDIETSYEGKVKVVFYDVWTKEGEPYGRKFKIRVIPTQVFLDEDGKEFYRHEGFFLASDIKKMLADHGVKP